MITYICLSEGQQLCLKQKSLALLIIYKMASEKNFIIQSNNIIIQNIDTIILNQNSSFKQMMYHLRIAI